MNYGPDTLLQGAASQDAGAKWGTGTASGFISGFGSVGQLFSPYLVAWISGKYGWDRLFYGFVVIAVAAGTLLATRWNSENFTQLPAERGQCAPKNWQSKLKPERRRNYD